MSFPRKALGLLALAGFAAASELDCRPAGVTDTVLDFSGRTEVYNNIGGMGINASKMGREELRLEKVGITGTHSSVGAGQLFDLVIKNTSEYLPEKYEYTGIAEQFGVINVRGPRPKNNYDEDLEVEVTFSMCAELTGTTTRLVLDEFPLTFYDL